MEYHIQRDHLRKCFRLSCGPRLSLVDGNILTPDSSGNFTLDKEYIYGTNLIESYAVDLDGNDSKDVRAVLSGEFHPKDTRFDDAIMIYLGDNSEGLGHLKNMLTDTSPIWISAPCSQQETLSMNLNVLSIHGLAVRSDIRFACDSTAHHMEVQNIDISTNSNGTISANATINNISIGWVVSGTVDTSGSVTANNASVNMTLTPYVSNDQLYINLDSVSSSFSNLNFNVSGLLGDIIDFFGLDSLIENEMESYAEDAIRDVVTDEIPPVLEEVLSDFSISEQFTVMDTTYELSSVPSDVHVDNNGLTLTMTSNRGRRQLDQPDDGLGSLVCRPLLHNRGPAPLDWVSISP